MLLPGFGVSRNLILEKKATHMHKKVFYFFFCFAGKSWPTHFDFVSWVKSALEKKA